MLKDDPAAPEWVREHRGPFDIYAREGVSVRVIVDGIEDRPLADVIAETLRRDVHDGMSVTVDEGEYRSPDGHNRGRGSYRCGYVGLLREALRPGRGARARAARDAAMTTVTEYPAPDELLTAHDTLTQLGRAVFADTAWEGDRMKAWESVVEARLRLAQVTSALGAEYDAVWRKMAGQE